MYLFLYILGLGGLHKENPKIHFCNIFRPSPKRGATRFFRGMEINLVERNKVCNSSNLTSRSKNIDCPNRLRLTITEIIFFFAPFWGSVIPQLEETPSLSGISR